jgi:hypothetical protein
MLDPPQRPGQIATPCGGAAAGSSRCSERLRPTLKPVQDGEHFNDFIPNERHDVRCLPDYQFAGSCPSAGTPAIREAREPFDYCKNELNLTLGVGRPVSRNGLPQRRKIAQCLRSPDYLPHSGGQFIRLSPRAHPGCYIIMRHHAGGVGIPDAFIDRREMPFLYCYEISYCCSMTHNLGRLRALAISSPVLLSSGASVTVSEGVSLLFSQPHLISKM